MDVALAPSPDGGIEVGSFSDGALRDHRRVGLAEAPGAVRELNDAGARWFVQDTALLLPRLLRAGVTLDRVMDLWLTRRILEASAALPKQPGWKNRPQIDEGALFQVTAPPATLAEIVAEAARQEASIVGSADAARLRILVHAESAGSVLAREMEHEGVPFSSAVHHEVLTRELGARGAYGRPASMEALAMRIRRELGAPNLNPDSPQELLAALKRHGLDVASTARWELCRSDDPIAADVIEYKRLARLYTANGWAWAAKWVRDGRLHTVYTPGAAATGRWGTDGGGAMQIARDVRAAIVAEPGHLLVVADASQLEPRVLAGLSRDAALARAGEGRDLYQGLVDQGAVDTREHAKIAMLAALYGASRGEAGRLIPRLARSYPNAFGAVEAAARMGERGARVRTWLGRTSPLPPRSALSDSAKMRAWGRFTRNFIVQGSAAEWALCWLAVLRTRIRQIEGAHIVSFLHDEVVLHVPAEHAEAIVQHTRDAADIAGRMLFGAFPITFPLSAHSAGSYDKAKT